MTKLNELQPIEDFFNQLYDATEPWRTILTILAFVFMILFAIIFFIPILILTLIEGIRYEWVNGHYDAKTKTFTKPWRGEKSALAIQIEEYIKEKEK